MMDDYLVLYVHLHDLDQSSLVQLLAIKHQKQLGFDLLAATANRSQSAFRSFSSHARLRSIRKFWMGCQKRMVY